MIDGRDIPDLLPGTLYMLVLRALGARALHGYAIARRIKDTSANALEIEDGSLYPALNRMLVKGWLKAEWGMSENNRRARFYKLTADGRTAARTGDQAVREAGDGHPTRHADRMSGRLASRLMAVWRRLTPLGRASAFDRELDEEIALHIEMQRGRAATGED